MFPTEKHEVMGRRESPLKLIIAVIGGSDATPRVWAIAKEVGRELAIREVAVVCGGLTGVMEAVCIGAKEVGGSTIGILPGSDPRQANPYVDVPVCTAMGYARNVAVVLTGRAVIAVDGSYGTLSEIGHALAEDVPVIGLDTWGLARNGLDDGRIIVATDATDAVDKAIAAAHIRDSGQLGGYCTP